MISRRQFDMLMYIYRYSAQNNFAPSMREVGLGTGITSTSIVNYNINRLIACGYLIKSPGKSRTLVLTKPAIELLETHQSHENMRDQPEQSQPTNLEGDSLRRDPITQELEVFEAGLVDDETSRLREENHMLRNENERLRREHKNRVAGLQREILHLAKELRHLRDISDRYSA